MGQLANAAWGAGEHERAKAWHQRAVVDFEDPASAYWLAQKLLEEDEEKSLETLSSAVALFELAARGGCPKAKYNLGIAHLEGFGVPKRNRKLSIAWFRESGLPEGMRMLVVLYESQGHHKKAAKWTARAALAGFDQPWYQVAVARAGRADLESA